MITSKLTVVAISIFAITASVADIGAGVNHLLQPAPVQGSGFVRGSVYPGQDAQVNWAIIKQTDCAGESSRIWIGEGDFSMMEAVSPILASDSHGKKRFVSPVTVPEQAPKGALSMVMVGHYQCEGEVKQGFSLGPVEMIVGE